MKLPMFGQLEFEKMMPLLIGAVFLVAVVIVLNKIIKNIFFQSVYLEALRTFAGEHGYKKPISKWLFILIEIAGVFLALFFITSFFKNAFITVGILLIIVVISVFFGIKFYTPPFKAFALAENLTYNGDVVYGNYNGRDIFMKMEKESIEFHQDSMSERNQRVDIVKRIVSVSLSLDNKRIENIRYEDGKITIEPDALRPDLFYPEKMLGNIPVSDNPQLYISIINKRDYLTIEKINRNFLYTAELYYICEAAERIVDAIK